MGDIMVSNGMGGIERYAVYGLDFRVYGLYFRV
jgi:hypothetical protein